MKLLEEIRNAIVLPQEKGALSWFSAFSLMEHGFTFHNNGVFRDAMALRYGWTPKEILVECVCGTCTSFTMEHASSLLPKGKVSDVTA